MKKLEPCHAVYRTLFTTPEKQRGTRNSQSYKRIHIYKTKYSIFSVHKVLDCYVKLVFYSKTAWNIQWHWIIFHLCLWRPDFVIVNVAPHIISKFPLPVSFFLLTADVFKLITSERRGNSGIYGWWWTVTESGSVSLRINYFLLSVPQICKSPAVTFSQRETCARCCSQHRLHLNPTVSQG